MISYWKHFNLPTLTLWRRKKIRRKTVIKMDTHNGFATLYLDLENCTVRKKCVKIKIHKPSWLFCSFPSSFSSSLLLPWLSPHHPPAARTSLAGRQKVFLCGTSCVACCCQLFAARHWTKMDPASLGVQRSPHAAHTLLHFCWDSCLMLLQVNLSETAWMEETWASCLPDCCSSLRCKEGGRKVPDSSGGQVCCQQTLCAWVEVHSTGPPCVLGSGSEPLKVQILPPH